jgi:DNA-binding response OmpR family regulator
MAKRILLIEDEPNIIEAICFILSRDGWTVHTHSNGETAAERVRSLPPDVVILDVMLPGRSGFDILRDIRADPAIRALPVMMLTARGQARDRELAEQLGVNHFMTKPFSNADMLRNIRSLVRPAEADGVAAPVHAPVTAAGSARLGRWPGRLLNHCFWPAPAIVSADCAMPSGFCRCLARS